MQTSDVTTKKHEFYSCKLILFQTVGVISGYYEIKIKHQK